MHSYNLILSCFFFFLMSITQRLVPGCMYVCYDSHLLKYKITEGDLMQEISVRKAGNSMWMLFDKWHVCSTLFSGSLDIS